MTKHLFIALIAATALGACATSTAPVPSGQALTAAEIPALVGGGPYALTIYDGEFAGTTGQTTWDFATRTVSGSFTSADGSGTFEMPISIEGNTLCAGADDARECHFVFANEGGGFLEVNADGSLHAASLPM